MHVTHVDCMALNDIEIYQLIRTAFALCDEVGTAMKARREFNLADQLLRAALSVGNNFAEGYGRSATGERLMLMFYADGSAQECKNCLNSAVDLNIIEAGKAQELNALFSRISIGIIEFCAWILRQDPDYNGAFRERVEKRRAWRFRKR